MKSDNVNYFVVGLFVLAMLVATIVAVSLLSGHAIATNRYYTSYKSVAGITFGSKVLYMGFPVGQVEAIIPDWETGRFKLELSVKRKLKIPECSRAEITTSGLLSAITIDIQDLRPEPAEDASRTTLSPDGCSPTAFLDPDDTIPSKEASNLFVTMGDAADRVIDAADRLIKLTDDSGQPFLDRLNELLAQNGQVDQLLDEFTALASDAKGTLRELKPLATGLADELQKTNEDIRAVVSPENRARLAAVLDNTVELTDGLKATRDQVERFVARLDALVADNRAPLDASIDDLRHTLHTVAEHIDLIVENLDGTSRNMYEFSREIRGNPGLLLGGTPPQDAAAEAQQ